MGGGGGGGAMLKNVAGAIIGSPSDPLDIPRTTATAAAATTTNLNSHHPFSSRLNLPLSASRAASFNRPSSAKCSYLDSVDGREDKRASGSSYDKVFGPVPSRIEVENAMSDLQRFMLTSKPEFNLIQQILFRYDPNMLQSFGYRRFHDAYRLLQTEPSVQRMVISISSDKAVWDAILNNEAVQDLRGSLFRGSDDSTNCNNSKEERPGSSNEESDLATIILEWILGIMKSKVVELIEKFVLLMTDLFLPAEKEKPTSELTHLLEEKVRSSLLLSVVIFLIVIVTRSHGM